MKSEKAFPVATSHHATNEGMDLRDWFAAKAMTALIASPGVQSGLAQAKLDPAQATADGAYDYANAMMKARAK